MTQKPQREPADAPVSEAITQLAREASIEINVHDLKDLEASRDCLPKGKKIYVSFLPKQAWQESEHACRALRQAGFEPVPHVPVRLLDSEHTFDRLLANLTQDAQVREILLIAGDYPQAVGPFTCVADALQSGLLGKHGLRRVSIAGHPEGHPQAPLEEIRRAEREKAAIAAELGLEASFVTQFFFESAPFLKWTAELRASGVQARIVSGLAGPARITTLFKFATRCGIGPSIRALGARPTSIMKLIGDHGPQKIMRTLAEARSTGATDFNGIHLFCFGGYLRTCKWLHGVANGRFTLNDTGGFDS